MRCHDTRNILLLLLLLLIVLLVLLYASVVWNSITTDANKLVRIQSRFSALCFNRFFPEIHYCHSLSLEQLKLHSVRMRRHRPDALFLTQVYSGLKLCPSVLEIAGLRVPARYIKDLAW
jgi:hypothetical protein